MRVVLAVVAIAIALASCYSPTISDGQYSCPDGTTCPSGLTCSPCGLCVHPGAATSVGCPGCSNGARSTTIGGPLVAVCPAAWTVPGIQGAAAMATPCDHAPGMDGTANGKKCSVTDNCAAGWHLCADDAELKIKGFGSDECAGLEANQVAVGFWVTSQPGDIEGECVTTGTARLIGCGRVGLSVGKCTVSQRFIGTAYDNLKGRLYDCTRDPSISADWSCGIAGMEQLTVTKTSTKSGGVICCRD
jgi:hypothetical protein